MYQIHQHNRILLDTECINCLYHYNTVQQSMGLTLIHNTILMWVHQKDMLMAVMKVDWLGSLAALMAVLTESLLVMHSVVSMVVSMVESMVLKVVVLMVD